MQLMRDLGIMQLDEAGRWIDIPLDELICQPADPPEELPPPVPHEWFQMLDEMDLRYPEDGSSPLPPPEPLPPTSDVTEDPAIIQSSLPLANPAATAASLP
jgi:hypothetical protein